MKKRARKLSLHIIFTIINLLLRVLPYKISLWVGARLGAAAYILLAKERRKAEANLEFAFADTLTRAEREKIAKNVFRNLGRTTVEIAKMPFLKKAKLNSLIDIHGIANLKEAAAKNKGIIVVTSHLGNWEMLAAYFAANYSANVMARRLRDTRFDAILNSIRRAKGVNVIYRDEPPRRFLEALKKDGILGILPDQDVDSVEGVFVDFFGHPAYTPSGPVSLALASGAPILPVFIVRNGVGHKVFCEPPIYAAKSDNKEQDLLNYTKAWSEVVERYVRRYPEQWAWMHKRWKTKPRPFRQGE